MEQPTPDSLQQPVAQPQPVIDPPQPPVAQPQPVVGSVPQPVEQPQPVVESAPQPMPQPTPQQPAPSAPKAPKKPMNPLMMAGLIYGLVVVVLVGAIVAILATRNNSGSGNLDEPVAVNPTDTPDPVEPRDNPGGDDPDEIEPTDSGDSGQTKPTTDSSKPTPELTESVCKKRGGIFSSYDSASFGDIEYDDAEDEDWSEESETAESPYYYCQSDNFYFGLTFLSDDQVSLYADAIRSSMDYSPESYVILENSDDYIKTYSYLDGMGCTYMAMHKNMIVTIVAENTSFAEDLLVELGLPDRSRATDNAQSGQLN